MSTVEDSETTGEADLADLLPTGSIEPQVAGADPLDLSDPVGLLVGLSIVVPAVLIEAWRSRPAVDPSAPSLREDDPAWDQWDPWLARERSDIEADDR